MLKFLAPFLLALPLSATTYYVDPGGSNGANGSIGTPWATLSHACGTVSGVGDTIRVNAGSYTDNSTCTLALGVKIQGASSTTVNISTTANPYISAVSSVPTVNGSNEISGLHLTGGGSNQAISSQGRNNQSIHDNIFTNFPNSGGLGGILVEGKQPQYIDSVTTCSNFTTATFQTPNNACTVQPRSTDWATGITVYNNTATNTNLMLHSIQGAQIHDNSIDNSANSEVSCYGHTAYFWSGVNFYGNTCLLYSPTMSNFGLEIFGTSDDSKFHNNRFTGEVSLVLNANGGHTPYSYEVYDNDFSSNAIKGSNTTALEIGYYGVINVRVDRNYFANTGSNNTWDRGIGLWGNGTISGYYITRNVFYNLSSIGIEIESTQTDPDMTYAPPNFSSIYVENNVFDTVSAGIQIDNDNTVGRSISGVYVRNNIITNIVSYNYGVVFWPQPTYTLTSAYYDHNDRVGGAGDVDTAHSNAWTVGTTFSFSPQIMAAGSRWNNWYLPSSPSAKIVGVGVIDGTPFSGAAQTTLGPGSDASSQPATPTGLAVIVN